MIIIPNGTKAILLDLGGVLLNLYLQKTFDAFEQLGFNDFNKHFDSYSGSKFIEDFEEGKTSEENFINILKENCNVNTTTLQVLNAWNAMLADVPLHKFEQMQEWKKEYKLFLFSNTNALHVAHLHQYYDAQFGKDVFQNQFNKIYYSQELGLRKPHKEGFIKIIEEQKLQPNEIFYIDDGEKHIATANSLGVNCLLWKMNEKFV